VGITPGTLVETGPRVDEGRDTWHDRSSSAKVETSVSHGPPRRSSCGDVAGVFTPNVVVTAQVKPASRTSRVSRAV
jgi:hypothetical protein